MLLSEEGTTQGDPLAMLFYVLATIPLLQHLPLGVVQVWYADDACAGGKLCVLLNWWDNSFISGFIVTSTEGLQAISAAALELLT